MIEYCYETAFTLQDEDRLSNWINRVVEGEDGSIENLVYTFCDDHRLLELNTKYLNHDTLTDILTFPYESASGLQADIFISVPRVMENAGDLGIKEEEELRRVMIHGVLHLLGYKDHTSKEKETMRKKEDEKLKLFHVEH